MVKLDSKGKPVLGAVSSYIFNELLCNEQKLPYADLTIPGWECFESFFTQLNHASEAMIVPPRVPLVVLNHSKITGLDALWNIATKATHTEVAAKAVNMLTTLYVRVDWSMTSADKKAIFKAFLDRTMAGLKAGAQEKQKLNAAKDSKVDDKPLMHKLYQLLVSVRQTRFASGVSLLFRLLTGVHLSFVVRSWRSF
jgi:hypothetical protein